MLTKLFSSTHFGRDNTTPNNTTSTTSLIISGAVCVSIYIYFLFIIFINTLSLVHDISLPSNELIYKGSTSFSTQSALLHRHVSAVALNGQTKHLLTLQSATTQLGATKSYTVDL